MKKALLIIKINNIIDIEYVEYLTRYLNELEFTVDISPKNNFEENSNIRYNVYNIIFFVNRKPIRIFQKNTSIIYCINSDRFIENWVAEDKYDLTIQYGYKKNNFELYWPSFYSNIINTNINYKSATSSYYDIFFIISDIQKLLELSWFINLHYQKKIAIFCENKKIPVELFNNIDIILQKDIDDVMLISKCVVGYGPFIGKAILLQKHVIVVGPLGYGGVITPKNILNQFREGFSGRLGGALNEFIPHNLLDHDYKTLYTIKRDEELKIIRDLLNEDLENEKTKIKKVIDIYSDMNLLISTERILYKNTIYSYLFNANLNVYIVVNNSTNKLLYQIPVEEFEIIEHFKIPSKINELHINPKSMNLSENKKRKIIKKLIRNKLLIHKII